MKRVVEIAKATRFIENARENPYIEAAELTVLPPDNLIAGGFPVENVRIFGDLARPTVQLIGGRNREWKHVYRRWGLELCLWTPLPEEPDVLQWQPEDGWEQLFLIIQRHLVLEELARRTGRWVAEDAHGTPGHYSPGEYRPPTRQLVGRARRWRPPNGKAV